MFGIRARVPSDVSIAVGFGSGDESQYLVTPGWQPNPGLYSATPLGSEGGMYIANPLGSEITVVGGDYRASEAQRLEVVRATLDVDLVAEIRPSHVGHFVSALQDAYYVDEGAVIDAIDRRSTFNLVHLVTMIKVDVFLPKDSDYERESFARRKRDRLSEESEVEVYIASPEDVILHKLDWYSRGGEISERQWSDLIGVMKVQGNVLDVDYLQRWAIDLGVEQLLDRAIDESSLK